MRIEMTARYDFVGRRQPRLLDIGPGAHPFPGAIGVDRRSVPGVHVLADAGGGLPFADSSLEGIRASHVIEHLPSPMPFFREAWRVLRDGGTLLVVAPHLSSLAATWGDPTHTRPYSANSFFYLDSTKLGNYADGFDFRVVNVRLRRRGDEGLVSRLTERLANFSFIALQRAETLWAPMIGGFAEVQAVLTAVKRDHL